MTGDTGFVAPLYQRPTPPAVREAGRRLHRYATEHSVPRDQPITDMIIVGEPDQVESLARDQRLLAWYVDQLPS